MDTPAKPSDRDLGWLGRKTDYEKETLTIMSSGFMGVVALSGFSKASCTPNKHYLGERGSKTKKNSQLIGGKSFMVANSSDEGMASSVRNESTKGARFFKRSGVAAPTLFSSGSTMGALLGLRA